MAYALIIALTIAVVLTILRIVDNYLDTHDQFGDELANRSHLINQPRGE